MKFNLVVAAGSPPSSQLVRWLALRAHSLTAVDGGLETLSKYTPDLFVGDGDSVTEIPNHTDVLQVSPDKNLSDLELALSCLDEKYDRIILGAHRDDQGRVDHGFSNLLLGLTGRNIFSDDSTTIFGVPFSLNLKVTMKPATTFSIISPNPQNRVSSHGGRYSFDNLNLRSSTHGIGNLSLRSDITFESQKSCLVFVQDSVRNLNWTYGDRH